VETAIDPPPDQNPQGAQDGKFLEHAMDALLVVRPDLGHSGSLDLADEPIGLVAPAVQDVLDLSNRDLGHPAKSSLKDRPTNEPREPGLEDDPEEAEAVGQEEDAEQHVGQTEARAVVDGPRPAVIEDEQGAQQAKPDVGREGEGPSESRESETT